MEIFFSVIIPTYNRKNYIVETIDSVLAQTYVDFEVVVVDDGSTDGTNTLVKAKYGTNPQVNYFLKANEERGAARNFGLAKAKGNYAVFLDSDDCMRPAYLATLADVIVKYSPDLFAAKYSVRDENGKEITSSMEGVQEGWYGLEEFLKGNMLACNYGVRIGSGLYDFPPERELATMEDWLFLLRNLVDRKIFIADVEGVVMREHAGRSVANNKVLIRAGRNATEWALRNIKLTPAQQKTLITYSCYFAGIHEYLDGNKASALQKVAEAVKAGGLKKEFILLGIKSLIGKKNIDRLK